MEEIKDLFRDCKDAMVVCTAEYGDGTEDVFVLGDMGGGQYCLRVVGDGPCEHFSWERPYIDREAAEWAAYKSALDCIARECDDDDVEVK